METFFRKYFWSVNVVFTLAVAFIAALIVNLFVESALAPAPSTSAPTAAARPPPEAPAQLTNDKLSKILGLPLPPPPEPEVNDSVAFDPNAAPVKSSLRAKLLGTLLSSLDEWSVASIEDVSQTPSKVSTYMIGDKILGAEVIGIERNRVIIKNGGRKEYIDNDAGDGAPPPVAMNVKEPVGTGIRELGENSYEVPRAEIDKTLSNLNDVAMQARIVPAFKDGVAQGFKLFSIRPDSIYTKIGVINGDVIKRINGFEMNDPAKALEVYTKLKDASRIDIELDRNGATLHKTYSIR